MIKKIWCICLLSLLLTVLLCSCGKDDEASTTNKEDKEASETSEESAISEEAAISTESYTEYISLADVTDLTGIQDLKLKENYSQLSFYAGEEKNVVLDVSFQDSSFYDSEVGDGEYYTVLSDVADKAAIAIPDAPYRVTLLQGETSVMIQTVPQDKAMKLTEDQLIEVAKLIVTRIKDK